MNIKVFAAIPFVVLALGCSRYPTQDAIDYTVIGASLDSPSSKTGLDGVAVVWDEDDELCVLSDNVVSGNEKFNIISAGKVEGTFKGQLPPSIDDRYIALYPYSETASYDGEVVSFNVPSEQQYREGGFAADMNPSIARFSYGTKDCIRMKNLCSVLKLQFVAPKGVCVSKITVSESGSNLLSGEAEVSLESLLNDAPMMNLKNGDNHISMNTPDIVLDSVFPTSFYFVVPAGSFINGLSVEITDDVNNHVYRLKTIENNLTIRSSIHEMPVVSLDKPEITIDLSEDGTSNCYLVNEPQACSCKFFAGAKGNAGLNASGAEALSPSSVELLWATQGTPLRPSKGSIIDNVRLSNGYICFETRGNKGNAVIAAKDADGQIIWSWHIWIVPGMDISSSSARNVLGPLPDGGYWIDRNLGALGNTEDDPTSAGLLYQWGRKDPFTATSDFTSSGTEYTDIQMVQGVEWTVERKASTVGESIISPTTFFASKNWLEVNDNTLWGPKKTIYDPCPVGYVVAPYLDFSGIKVNKSTYGVHLLYGGKDVGWFPMSGRRDEDTGNIELVSRYTHLWTSYSSDSGVGRYYFYMGNDKLQYDRSQKSIRGMGNSVRCSIER